MSFLLLSSCVTNKVGPKNNYNYSGLKTFTEYIITKKDGEKVRQFEFVSENDNEIQGRVGTNDLVISKNDIDKIAKFSFGKTVLIGVVAVAVAIIIPAYAKNEPVGGSK